MSNFHLDLYDTSGVRQAILSTEVLSLDYQTRVNNPGKATFILPGYHEVARLIQPGWRCDIWRELPTGTWRKEFISFIEQYHWNYQDRPEITFTSAGLLSLLSKRIVAFYANTANKTAFVSSKAELIAKLLIRDNIGSLATTTNGRLVDGVITGFDYDTNQNRGATLDWYCAWENLLTTMQKLAKAGSFDFDVLPNGTGYRYYYYPNQLGTDRTASIIFSLERGNIARPHHYLNTNDTANIVIVGGKGEDAERQTQVAQGSLSYGTINAEVFLNATDVETDSALLARGNDKLNELKALPKFEFEILQADNARWNVDYFLGDLVKVISPMNQQAITAKIDSAEISFDRDGRETIDIGVKS